MAFSQRLEIYGLAAAIMEERDILMNDLFALVERHPDWLSDDGVHFNGKGKEAQATAVAKSVLKCLPESR